MNKQQHKHFVKMQQLSDSIYQQTAKLEKSLKQLNKLQQQQSELQKMYENHWRDLAEAYEAGEISEADIEAVNLEADTQHYSVLGEDTIWNVLMDADEVQKQWLKQLVKAL